MLGKDDGLKLCTVLGSTLGGVLGILEWTKLGEYDGNILGSVLGDLKGCVLGSNDGIKLGFVLGDLEGSVLGGGDRLFRLRSLPATVGCLRRRTTTVGLPVGVGTEVGEGFRLRRRATTVDLPVGTEVGDTGRRLGCLVGFLLGGYVVL
eukprot:scaffold421316_cov65-Attheya_sp.AAC.1